MSMTRVIELRLTDTDRERYGGEEWMPLNLDAYDDMPLAEQAALERQMLAAGGVSLFNLLRPGGEIARDTAVGRVSAAWLARQQAGLTDPAFGDFQVNQHKMGSRVAGLSVPLDEGSPTSGETVPEPSPLSPETAPSTRRSRSSSRR